MLLLPFYPHYFISTKNCEIEYDDIKTIIKCNYCCYKASCNLSNHLLSELGLFTPHNYWVSCSLGYSKL